MIRASAINRWSRAIGAAVFALAAMLVAGSATGPASAHPLPQAALAGAELTLVSQTPLVPANGVFTARVDLGELAQANVQVEVTVFSVLDDATELEAAPSRPLNRLTARPLSELPVDGAGILTLDLPIRSAGPFDDIERMRIPDAGVYPVVIELGNEQGVVASTRLNLIRLPTPESAVGPRKLALVVGVGGPQGLTVEEATSLLESHPDLPVTVVLGPGVVARLQANAAQVRSLSGAIGQREVLAVVEPNLDPSSLSAIGQDELYRRAVANTADALARLGLNPVPATTISTTIGGPLTKDGAELLAQIGASIVVDLAAAAEPARAPSVLTTSAGPLTMVDLDPGPLAPVESGSGSGSVASGSGSPSGSATGPALARAHRQLARLMIGSASAPPLLLGGFGSPAVPNTAVPNTGPLRPVFADPAVLDLLLDVIDPPDRAEPALQMLPLAEAVAAQPAQPGEPAPGPGQDLAPVADALDAAQDLLSTYDSFYVGGPSSPAEYRLQLEQALALERSATQRSHVVERVNRELSEGLSLISLPANQSVTLAARSAPIPLTIENASSGARNVLLQFQSDKIVVAEQGQIITVEPGTSSIDIQLEARSLGVSPLEVTVLTPDGRRVLAVTRFRVRSTAIPGLGLLISAAGLAGLAVWWYLSIKRRGAAPLAAVADDDHPPPSDDDLDRAAALVADSVQT